MAGTPAIEGGRGQGFMTAQIEGTAPGVIEDPNYPIYWPHDRQSPRPRRVPLRRPRLENYMTGVTGQEKAMVRLNGDEALPLGNKYSFVELVSEMGYKTPRQTIVEPGVATEGALTEFAAEPNLPLMCKPLNGNLGRGIVQIPASELPSFLAGVGKKPFVIQEKIPITQEMRYFREVDELGEVIRRAYWERDILRLVGDGQKTNLRLLREAETPWYLKFSSAVSNARVLHQVMPEGQTRNVRQPLSTIFKPKEELEWSEGRQERMDNMDRFMRQFLTDLQTKLRVKLPYLSFDLGVVDPTILDGEYNFEKMKAGIYFFESQMPFLMTKYMLRSARPRTVRPMTRILVSPGFRGRKADFYPQDTLSPSEGN